MSNWEQDAIHALLNAGADIEDAQDYLDHWQNQLSDEDNVKRYMEYMKDE